MTSSSDADGDIKVDLSGEIATDRMSFTITAEISKVNKEGQPMPLKHDDYATFNIFMVGHDETDLEVVFDDFTIRYQDTVNPVNSELKTDLYETTKTFDFYVYDTSVKAPDDLTINISKPKEGSTPGVTIQPGEASVESHSDEGYMILHLPVTIGREQQTLTGGNFAIFDATIGLAGGATA
ncbi:MAG: hypothetical protein MJ200_03810 [Mycoplasmoidaceae bacterium]|nr:hypothetical protein [Mycoplasmoidaceae bacterium]